VSDDPEPVSATQRLLAMQRRHAEIERALELEIAAEDESNWLVRLGYEEKEEGDP
jgi:hypothetical protein